MKWIIAVTLTLGAAALLARRSAGQGGTVYVPAALFDASTEPASADATTTPDDAAPPSLIDDMKKAVVSALSLWRPPAKYADAIAQAEDKYGLPRDILARLLYQESRYREDIINGRTRSPVGAIGIAQFMPDTAPDWAVNLYDGSPWDDINGAAHYLAWLYQQTGTWTKALAAYNWGIGNVKRKGLAAAPAETTNYYTQILADVNTADGTAWA